MLFMFITIYIFDRLVIMSNKNALQCYIDNDVIGFCYIILYKGVILCVNPRHYVICNILVIFNN